MPKDNKNFPLPAFTADDLESPTQPFAPAQMVNCTACLRANPPTRMNCIYCGLALPLNDATLGLQRPTLRRLEKWELGYNNIRLADAANAAVDLAESTIAEVAELVRMSTSDLRRILAAEIPLPVALAASMDEATLIETRLRASGIETRVVSDDELGLTEAGPARLRRFDLDDTGICLNQAGSPVTLPWTEVLFVVTGRLLTTRVEVSEQKGREEHRVLDASEFFNDEFVMDLYVDIQPGHFRIAANSFDFSCLDDRKQLVAGDNMLTLLQVFRERCSHLVVDETYNRLRKVLEPVWPSEQQNGSSGWRRERPGKYSVGSVTEKNNEKQFTRYSLLRRYLQKEGLSAVK